MVTSVFSVYGVEVLPGHGLRDKVGVRFIYMTQVLYYFHELVIVADDIKLLILLLEHIFTWREREARSSSEKHTRKLALFFLVLLALVAVGGLEHFG